MKKMLPVLFFLVITALTGLPARAQQNQSTTSGPLYEQLLGLDSLLFNDPLHTCNQEALQAMLTKDFMFYHDNGLENPIQAQTLADFTASVMRICQQQLGYMPRRQLLRGSVQAFAVNKEEAVQTGVQHFYITPPGRPEKLVEVSRFSRTWKKEGSTWKLASEIDYEVNTHPADPAATARYQPAPYVPDDQALLDTIAGLDSIFFNAYNTCNLSKMKEMIASDVEFYHDRGGLQTSRDEVLGSTQKYICGKVTRELAKGSIEAYPIRDWGALQIGYHRFHNLAEGSASHYSKFITLWKRNNGQWQMQRVISLH